jgi:curved DNA-binding protein CbpA
VTAVTDGPDPYKVLQVDPEAEDEVIQAAYRRLAQKYHPDRSVGQAAIDRMVAINAAWEIIGDPERRASHDLARRAPRAVPEAVAPAEGNVSRDQAHPSPVGEKDRAQGAGGPGPAAPRGAATSQPATVSRDWTPGRSTTGSGYDARTMRAPEGFGAAGPPPGHPSGSVLTFGRYAGWSIGEVGRVNLEYLEWLDRMPIGRPHRDEIDGILRRSGRRRSAAADATRGRGLFRRR